MEKAARSKVGGLILPLEKLGFLRIGLLSIPTGTCLASKAIQIVHLWLTSQKNHCIL